MKSQSELDRLCAQARVVVFHSPVTDLGGLDDALTNAGAEWMPVELGMGNSANRELFQDLKAMTGHRTLPQVFVDGAFVGGIEALPQCLGQDAAAPRAAAWMGSLWLLPFLTGMVGMSAGIAGAGIAEAGTWVAASGAVMLSFVGAVHGCGRESGPVRARCPTRSVSYPHSSDGLRSCCRSGPDPR